MPGMFYSLKEAADKLNMTEQQVQQLAKEGKLREFRDGANVLFKVDEVEALIAEIGKAEPEEVVLELDEPAESAEAESAAEAQATESLEEKEQPAEAESQQAPAAAEPEPEAGQVQKEAAQSPPGEAPEQPPAEVTAGKEEPEQKQEEEISLASDTTGELELEEIGTGDTSADTEGLKVLGETDSDLEISDTGAETAGLTGEASLEEIEEDVNLDSFGSGSGLLDLSLQADDTSLGGVLDEIYTAEGEQETTEGPAIDLSSEPQEGLAEEQEAGEPEPSLEAAPVAAVYAEPVPDKVSNALGIILFVPLLAVLYTAIVAITGFNNVMPQSLRQLQRIGGPGGIHIIWYIAIVLALVAGLIVGGTVMLGRSGSASGKKQKGKKAKQPKEEK